MGSIQGEGKFSKLLMPYRVSLENHLKYYFLFNLMSLFHFLSSFRYKTIPYTSVLQAIVNLLLQKVRRYMCIQFLCYITISSIKSCVCC